MTSVPWKVPPRLVKREEIFRNRFFTFNEVFSHVALLRREKGLQRGWKMFIIVHTTTTWHGATNCHWKKSFLLWASRQRHLIGEKRTKGNSFLTLAIVERDSLHYIRSKWHDVWEVVIRLTICFLERASFVTICILCALWTESRVSPFICHLSWSHQSIASTSHRKTTRMQFCERSEISGAEIRFASGGQTEKGPLAWESR